MSLVAPLTNLVNEVASALKPKTKNNKTRRSRPAKKNKNKTKIKTRNVPTRYNSTETLPLYSAPAAVGGGLPRVYTETYTPSSRLNGTHVGIRGCCWLTDIVSNATGVPNFATSTIPWNINTFFTNAGLYFGPIDPSVWRTPVVNLANAFTQFRTKSIILHYRPTCPSSTGGQIVLALSADVPTNLWSVSTIKQFEGSKSVAPWIPCDVTGTLDNTWKYVYDTNITFRDDNRFSDAGAICLNGSGAGASNTLLGQLYVSFDFEFRGHAASVELTDEHKIDAKPIVVSEPTPTPSRFFR